MNERIREIKAKSLVPIQKEGYTSWVFDEQKFAELIVLECAQFCEDKNSKLLGTMLKEHFGVK